MRCARLAVVVCSLVLALPARTESVEVPAHDIEVVRNDLVISLGEDGSITREIELEARALTGRGRERMQSYELDVDLAIEQVEVEEACSVAPGGQRRCTDLDQVVVEPDPDRTILPGRCEPHRVIVPFEAVAVGSTTTLRYRRATPAGDAQPLTTMVRGASHWGPTLQRRVQVRHPAARPVYAHMVGDAEHLGEVDEGVTTDTWELGPQPEIADEHDRPGTYEIGEVLHLSEFADWQAFVDWYLPHAEGAAERFRGPAARELTALTDPSVRKLDDALRLSFLVVDRAPAGTVSLSASTLLPGEMATVVRHAGTEVDKAIALWTVMRDAGVEGVHLALATSQDVGRPAEFPNPLMFDRMVVSVEGRGFVDVDWHAEYLDTVYNVLRGGAAVVLDPAGPRVVQGDELDPPEDRAGYHRSGRIIVRQGEVRTSEELRFSGSAAAAAIGYWRGYQHDLDHVDKDDREERIQRWVRKRGWAEGKVREAVMFEAWDPDPEARIELRHARTDLVEEVADLLTVRLPLEVDDTSRACVDAPAGRTLPLEINANSWTWHYELVNPEGYELLGLPEDVHIDTDLVTVRLQYSVGEIQPEEPDEDEEPEEDAVPEGPQPGVVVDVEYTIHANRVPPERYEEFRAAAMHHVLAATDPIVFVR